MNRIIDGYWRGLPFWGIVWLATSLTQAQEKSVDPVDFASQIRPLLSSRCFQCHGPDDSSRKAKLRLDLHDEAIKERKGGVRAVVPGEPARSEAIRRITQKDPDEIMPPPEAGQPLQQTEITLLKRWIEQGASYAPHWAFQKPERPRIPSVKSLSWPRHPMDYFILQKLEQHSLNPSPGADRFALIRRLSLDLIGLPPTPAEIEAFADDTHPDAYERVVDRLLSSPAYGERWARVWLDLARYADSAGYGSDPNGA